MDAAEHASKRAAVTAELRRTTGIDDAMIEKLVREFYLRVQADPMLGPVFDAHIKDWEPHLQRMFAFWSSVALMSGVYHGRPMEVHMRLPVDSRHFDRWLTIFAETAGDVCPPAAARHFVDRAQAIAQSLEMGIASVNGKRLAPGERYRDASLAV